MSKLKGTMFFSADEIAASSASEGGLLDKAVRASAGWELRDYVTLALGGVLPTSILRASRGVVVDDLAVDGGRDYLRSSYLYQDLKSGKTPGGPLATLAVVGSLKRLSSGVRKGALSRFPQNVGRVLTLMFSDPGDLVFDPFAGHNSRMELVASLGRRYLGYDVCKQYVKQAQVVREQVLSRIPMFSGSRGTKLRREDVQVVLRSSIKVHLKNETADFTITSPPYWDIEFYDNDPRQLGRRGTTYRDFLLGLGKCISEDFRVLKPGCFSIWCVNDFRKGGEFYSYHADVDGLLRKAGFEIQQVVIVDLGFPMTGGFVTTTILRHTLPKQHEYAIIAKKPGDRVWSEDGVVGTSRRLIKKVEDRRGKK